MKVHLFRFIATDRGKIVFLTAMIVLLAVGGVKLNESVAARLRRGDAEANARAWATSLVGGAQDIPGIIAGVTPSDQTKRLLQEASEVGNIYRYKVWNSTGRLVFFSDRPNSPVAPMTLAERHGKRIANAILSGSPFTEAGAGIPPANPAYFAKTYIPIKRNGTVIGIFEVYVDQTERQALYERSFLFTESMIAIGILLAGGLPGLIVYRQMIAQRKAQALALVLAAHDPLTGMPNRQRLSEAAKLALAWRRRSNTSVAALLLDLDRFKEINDGFGHGAGDELLQILAIRLNATVREEDMAARLGGDEFVVLQVGLVQPAGANALAERLQRILSEPFEVRGLQIDCRTSIGIAIAPADGEDWDTLLSCADVALYKAKAKGRNTVCFFESGMDRNFRERRQLEADLRRALAMNAFHLAYQPLFNLHDGTLVGFEALLRWPEGWSPQSPAAFIPVAEDSGLIVPIGAWVLETACGTAATWERPVKVAVNLSSIQFRRCDIVAVVRDALRHSGLDPARLELEVTESLWLQNTNSVLDQLGALRALGISIALDDFGTGYSSLNYLWKFPFDRVKIDRSFVAEMTQDAKAIAIVKTIVALGKTLDLSVTAEGVETQEQAQALADAGCDQVQGYWFGRPLPADVASALVQGSWPPVGGALNPKVSAERSEVD